MKPKIAIIASFAAASMLILPVSVYAFTITSSAWTNLTSYTLGDPVQIYVEWEVTAPQNFVHDYCVVDLHIHPTIGETTINPHGNYTVGPPSNASGVVAVYCNDDDGNAYYEWNSNEGWEGTWVVSVIVEGYDYSQTPPDDMPYDVFDSNTFTLS